MTIRRAAIDIGTVSTRLLVADVDNGRVDELVRHTTITHLGEGLTASGRLSDAAMDRVLTTVAGYVDEARSLGAEEFVTVATSASRDADNADVFVARLAALGIEPAVITGSREAELSFLGATYDVVGEGVLVIDLGGGSTELIVGDVPDRCPDDPAAEAALEWPGCARIEAARSFDVGSRRVTELFLATDPPTADELETAAGWVVEQMRSWFANLDVRPRRAVALAGTATTLAAIAAGMVDYDAAAIHGSVLNGADLTELKEDLAARTLAERRTVPGLDPGRADVIVAGALILETVLGLAGLDEAVVSEHDILYGLVLEGATGLGA